MTTPMKNKFTPNGLPVLIGSLPLSDHKEAIERIFAATSEIPLWPQLPGNPLEGMMHQFAEGIPCIREENLRAPESRIFYDTSGECPQTDPTIKAGCSSVQGAAPPDQ
ncbi:MAG: hypothetical protein D3904_18295 [Candidatus Electrothrix sp. EH2]|nr:hypothetical protein [Candidatus Electrothrix sp. EH2]